MAHVTNNNTVDSLVGATAVGPGTPVTFSQVLTTFGMQTSLTVPPPAGATATIVIELQLSLDGVNFFAATDRDVSFLATGSAQSDFVSVNGFPVVMARASLKTFVTSWTTGVNVTVGGA